MLAPSLTGSSLSASAVAVLFSVPQSAASVTPCTVTDRDAPEARLPKLHERTPAAIEQFGLSGFSVQVMPAGSVSDSVTLKAIPGPLLPTVMVKLAVSPALIVPLPAVLSI